MCDLSHLRIMIAYFLLSNPYASIIFSLLTIFSRSLRTMLNINDCSCRLYTNLKKKAFIILPIIGSWSQPSGPQLTTKPKLPTPPPQKKMLQVLNRPEDALKRKAEPEKTVRKKTEFERKALNIVEQLLEENITENS